jgi:hypothetical protein
MANVAQLIRRQSSRELLRVPLDKLEMREMQHRLLPGPGETSGGGPYGGTANAAFIDETVTTSTTQQPPTQQQVR